MRLNRDAVTIAAAGLLLLFVLAEVQMWQTTRSVNRLRAALVDRCQERQEQDRLTVEDLQARIELYAAIIEMERTNRVASEQTRAQRVAAYTKAQTQAQVRLQGVPAPRNCATFYASE